MPRLTRKRTLLSPQKTQLLFVEQPKNGPKHDYGEQLRSAINPRTFISEQTQQNSASTSWVSPQFLLLEDRAVRRSVRGKKKNRHPTHTMNSTSILSLPQVRKTTACKYSALSFQTSAALPQRGNKALCKKTALCAAETPNAQSVRHFQGDNNQTVSPNNQNEVPTDSSKQRTSVSAKRQTATASKATVTSFRASKIVKTPLGFKTGKSSSPDSLDTPTSNRNYTPNTSNDFTPPNIETPEMAHSEHCHSSSIFRLLFSPTQPKTPPRTESLGLLVKDTPERDYGLKVTWRRRKKLMNLFTERGQLLVNEAMINGCTL
ncbi:RAD9, HUS1, RAD1-interacting nuclear orphan protein 1 [Hoplias malabaricus]|uniref:RAD9, HUS1, RAD1-interacting nuclear orphan protein 1 n=1 Tax=Hoplias malabaricus TaxID=27720 RepID=UPI003461E722